MISKWWYENLSLDIRRVLLYYLIYCFLFVFIHLALVSTFSFFHFLLDHDMNTIENWLNRNTWEILSFSKFGALFVTSKIVKLNRYDEVKYRNYFLHNNFWPTKKIFGMSLFLLTIFYAFIVQFGGGVNENQFKEELFYSSFIGSFMYYVTDFAMVYLLIKVFEVDLKKIRKIMYPCLIFFLISSKIALPYLNKFYVFLMIHFLTMFLISSRDRFVDVLVYALFVICPLSTIYGLDIVWDNAYSLFSYEKSLPVVGILGIWGLAVGYYLYSTAD